MRGLLRCAAGAVAVTVLTACGVAPGLGAGPLDEVRIMVPNPPGGGYDITARSVAAVAGEAELADDIEVFNLTGGAGTTALARLMYEQHDDRLLLAMGMGLVAVTRTEDSAHPITDATPLARLIEEPGAWLVPPESPFETLDDFLAAWADPDTTVRIGGGSAFAGPDHLSALLLAETVGVDVEDADYVWHDGGGELLAAIRSHDVDVASAGAGEYRNAIDAGELRVLAVTGPDRIDGIDAPTLKETGVDLEFTNWRGLIAPPAVSEESRDEMIDGLEALRESPQWRETLAANHWDDAFLAGDDYATFLTEEVDRIDTLLESLDLQ
ncbi:tripartite tricarboxylate transporter substrate binding protein [Spiractinospora alimapuensis]|uniref:Bug family tripartite tricarboxylate transporter substrate binding protein n=1 Tax=Spiractinospora alimapuensis TaxID=2820884 RepID=UPI001F348293|nr:tripartite tricarboxylate transporter substrate-binding protein [Spiractinospora alimapuensis]QVQ54557.1 tripartite tricarboxylate transporter substrate binding protein [Spiractinospora alimapuensis]